MTLYLALCSKNFASEEIINLIICEENKTKKVLRSGEKKQMELRQSHNMSKKSKLKNVYDKCISKVTSLQETLSAIDEEEKSVRNVKVLPPESGDRYYNR